MCMKCGSSEAMAGPRYVKDRYGYESLEYRCQTCGYSYRTATADESTGAATTLGGLPVVVDPSMPDDEFELRGKTTVRVKLK